MTPQLSYAAGWTDAQDTARDICLELMEFYDELAAERYGQGREADGNRYETAAEAMREAAKRIGRSGPPDE